MLGRLTAISLVAFTAVAHASDATPVPTGKVGEGHDTFHAFYQDLFNSKKHVSCCNNKDCRPTQSRMNGDSYEVMINGKWWKVEKDAVIPKQAPDGGAHVCAGDPSQQDPLGRVYCVILPPET